MEALGLILVLVVTIAIIVRLSRRDGGNVKLDQSWQRSAPSRSYAAPRSHPAPQRPATYDPGHVRPRELRGRAWVIDGDTIAIDRIKIRLAGIDAPELDEPWGQKAKWEMMRLCKGQIIRAEQTGETSYDRMVGTCYLPDGRDLGAELIKRGFALDFAHFSGGKYRSLETTELRRKLQFIRKKNAHSKVLD